jgi:hypothetical protein
VFRADEDFVFDAHAEAMKVFWELRISGDVYPYQTTASEQGGRETMNHLHTWLDGDHHPFLQPKIKKSKGPRGSVHIEL